MRYSVTPSDLAASVMAVPPLARTADGVFSDAGNAAVLAHLRGGGVTTVLYGGNALAQHWPVSVYADWLDRLAAMASDDTWLLPSVGPDAGKMMDQAAVLKTRRFPVALLVPMGAPLTHDGMGTALRRFHAECGVQLLVYIKTDGYIPAALLGDLVAEGVVFGVKYAVPRQPGEADPYLGDIVAAIGAERVISGFGEPPAIPHMLDDGLAGFTAGCVCIAPSMSMALLAALKRGDRAEAERLLRPMQALEALRGGHGEIRVLHDAISHSGIGDMGPLLLPMSPVDGAHQDAIAKAARDLLAAEQDYRAAQAA
ncbi:dihydrodipicolinate synthase family protein [Frigidibacter albus]|uniref:Dihydrodipicolinate synthase family protein n=1 Tax=Frigidibacter albus TaxID=1465486 RepID=A0A6L8VLW4_9RHOB|nr:dihydrodipicolinate synthase family protein [Frigidibacter albus]MZQ90532.1 dihydrodipicolinate synthase family protein [Frigidibacter albus]NBE32348.1 dihydrodipicolinate synthase family protein [Frigidibacter albus]GGH59298.1 dihydrodipicolinate synthase family protein [Frigidibacter albus]